jgi:sigma-54 dependent transcriptional regulator, acetoin dehydrogenase operon transcriptional activator AcoR
MVTGSTTGLYDARRLTEIARQRAWDEFILSKRDPNIATVVLNSWLRTRDLFQIDPALKRSPIVLTEEQTQKRAERLQPLRLGLPLLEQITEGLRDTQHMLAVCDADGYVVTTIGHSGVIDELAEINFRTGGKWNEQAAGTNGVGTALAERRAVQIVGAEHYVQAWQRWVCTAAPIRDPLSGEIIAVIDVTGYKEDVQLHTLLAVYSTATVIEQQLMLELRLEDKLLCDALLAQANRVPSDAILAVDIRGRVVGLNTAGERLLAACPSPGSGGKNLGDDLKEILRRAVEQGERHHKGYEQLFASRRLGREFRLVTSPVFHDGRSIGAIITVPAGAAKHTQSDCSDTTADFRGSRRTGQARYVFDDIVAASPRMAEAISLGRMVAASELPVLIAGESGTGKEMMAQSIHNASERSTAPFIAVNCGSIPEGLVDAEFFGYEEGAFTGARRGGNAGRFEQAHRGTIFLDEVSELSPRAQAALLRVLQEKEVLRVGAGTPRGVDVRVIAATNRDLTSELKANRFRSDLYYRLNGMVIKLPALRERPEDVAILVDRFLDELPGRARLCLSAVALNTLMVYRWPGNVRELRNVVHRAAILARGASIEVDNLPDDVRAMANDCAVVDVGSSRSSERARILTVLGECQGNVAEAARRIGVSRMTLYRKIRKCSVSRLEILKAANS